MHHLIRFIRAFISGLCLCGMFSFYLVAQSSSTPSFELTQYEFVAGTPQRVDLGITIQNTSANLLEIQSDLPGMALAIESFKIIRGENISDIWLTRDSVLFAGNVPQTAWVGGQKNSTVIRTTPIFRNGDRILIRLLLTIPKDHEQVMEGVAKAVPDPVKNYLTVAVSLSSTPDATSQYVPAKPILIKSKGSVK